MDRHSRSLIRRTNFHDTIGINLERNFDLRNATRSRRDVVKLEFAEKVVILGQGTLSLKDLNQDGWLCKYNR